MYYTINIIQTKKIQMGVACSTYRGEERCVQGLVGKPEIKSLLGKSRYVKKIILEWILNESIGREWT